MRIISSKVNGRGVYVEYDFFIDHYDNEKEYPSMYESDIMRRIEVISRSTIKGEHFMNALIKFELYTAEEIRMYFDREFEEHIMPIIENGREQLICDIEYFFMEMFESKRVNALEKLNIPKEEPLWELTKKKYY